MLEQIQKQMDEFSPSERQVGEWVLAHPREVANGTLASVAVACGTSEPTVVRFCRRVGLRGYRELGVRLMESLSRPDSYVHKSVAANDSTADAVFKVLDSAILSLVEVRNSLSTLPIDAAVHLLCAARQIAFMGFGASGSVANDATQKFFRLGIPCTAVVDTPNMLQFAAISDTEVVTVMISHSGEWPDLVKTATASRNAGGKVIALTHPDSSLAKAADLVLACHTDEDTSVYTPMNSRLAHLALLDAIHVALALQLGEVAVSKLGSAKDVLREHALPN